MRVREREREWRSRREKRTVSTDKYWKEVIGGGGAAARCIYIYKYRICAG